MYPDTVNLPIMVFLTPNEVRLVEVITNPDNSIDPFTLVIEMGGDDDVLGSAGVSHKFMKCHIGLPFFRAFPFVETIIAHSFLNCNTFLKNF